MIQVVEIPLPPSANRMYRKHQGRMRPSAEYLAWVSTLGWWLKFQRTKEQPTPCRVSILIIGGKGWRENNDIDNRLKPALDGLVKNGIIKDDASRYIKQEELIYRERPSRKATVRCFIRLEPPAPTWADGWEPPPTPIAAGGAAR